MEALLDLVRSPHSPWALLEGSSKEDHFLRELAIQNPLRLKDTFFYSYFKSLRMVNKHVSAVREAIPMTVLSGKTQALSGREDGAIALPSV